MSRAPAAQAVSRRGWLRWLLACGAIGAVVPGASGEPGDDIIRRGRPLRFPRDHGSHPGARTEWWYVTGWLADAASRAAVVAGTALPALGFQVTFFRSRTDIAPGHPSRFAAHQLLFAHVAIADLRRADAGRLRHDQRIARAGFGIAEAAVADTDVVLRDWSMRRVDGSTPGRSIYRIAVPRTSGGLELDLALRSTQPVLLQGDAGFSRKGPLEAQASHYYSQPQLEVEGRVRVEGDVLPVQGTAWLDHEWSETLLAPDAVGWDWIGMNLFDGRALTAFRLRRADGIALWAGGSVRGASESAARAFADGEVRFEPGRRWTSPASRASYPVQWQIATPAGRFTVQALLDAQELDSRGSTGAIYWEGLSELLDERGRRVGLGYLEMTGYASRLQL